MDEDTAPPEFNLHFEGEGTLGHTVPGTALVQAIQSIQRAVQLLAAAYEGDEPKQRLRVSHDMERKYAVVFSVPSDGSYTIPYHIGSLSTPAPALFPFSRDDIATVTKQYKEVLAAINTANSQDLRRIIPFGATRRKLLNEFKKMQPPPRTRVVASIEDAHGHKLLDGLTVTERLIPLTAADIVSPVVQTRLVTGRLEALDFQALSLRMTLPNGKQLSGTYADDFEPLLIENRRQLIQVRGEAVLNHDGGLRALNNITEIVEVDDNPISVTDFVADGKKLTATRLVEFDVAFDPEDGIGLYTATGPFHMLATGPTRDDLERAVKDSLAFLWEEYVLVENQRDFSDDASSLRCELLSAFSGASDAA